MTVLSIDTNIVLRLLTADEPIQTARARALVENSPVRVSTTVVLEAEWVLRRGYRLDRGAVLSGLRALLGIPNLVLDELDRVLEALELAEAGLDFADALHVAAAKECEAFVTFDRALIRGAARTLVNPPVREP